MFWCWFFWFGFCLFGLCVCLPVFGCLFLVSLCFFACLSSFTDWCTAHKQQFREQKKQRHKNPPQQGEELFADLSTSNHGEDSISSGFAPRSLSSLALRHANSSKLRILRKSLTILKALCKLSPPLLIFGRIVKLHPHFWDLHLPVASPLQIVPLPPYSVG